MLLCVDVGNSNITIGVFDKDELICSYRMNTKVRRTSDEYGFMLENFLRSGNLSNSDIEGECNSIKFFGKIENAFAHAVHSEVLPYFVFIEVELAAAVLVGIIIVIPWGYFKVMSFLFHYGLHVGYFFLYLGHSRSPYLHKEIFGGFWSLGHVWCRAIGCEILEPEQFGFLSTLFENLFYHRVVVIFSR